MTKSIAITRQYSTPTSTSYRLVITAVGTEIVHEIFKMFEQPLDPLTGEGTIDTFISVCSPFELTSLPINAPSDSSDGYFRVASFETIYDNADDLLIAWEGLIDSCTDLLSNLKAIENLSSPVTVTLT